MTWAPTLQLLAHMRTIQKEEPTAWPEKRARMCWGPKHNAGARQEGNGIAGIAAPSLQSPQNSLSLTCRSSAGGGDEQRVHHVSFSERL